jgi:hypothetical protein
MREWPSIVPAASEDYFIVLNRYGRHGVAFAETDINRADYEGAITDLSAVSALVRIEPSGWFISWAIERSVRPRSRSG